MNKTEMAEKLAKKTGLTKAKAVEVVDCIFSTESGEGIIAVELDAGRKVSVGGFGTFETRTQSARHLPAMCITIPTVTIQIPTYTRGLLKRATIRTMIVTAK